MADGLEARGKVSAAACFELVEAFEEGDESVVIVRIDIRVLCGAGECIGAFSHGKNGHLSAFRDRGQHCTDGGFGTEPFLCTGAAALVDDFDGAFGVFGQHAAGAFEQNDGARRTEAQAGEVALVG